MDDEVIPANELRFKGFCNLLEKLHGKKKNRPEQDKILAAYINDFKLTAAQTVGKKNSSIYPMLRLLLPNFERERTAYNLKETKLGALLVKVLSLNKHAPDAKNLLNFRSVSNAQDSDFAGVACKILKSRLRTESDAVNIGEINEILDTIASSVENKGTVLDNEFTHVIKQVSVVQLKWFLRIILKDLKLGMGNDRILALFHPDAPEYYKQCGNLAKVCDELSDGDTRPSDLGIQLFFAVSPMLSERFDVKHQLPADKTYQIEDKFDGERFQMHMENGVFEYFSRKGHSYACTYGSTYDTGLLTPHLKEVFNPNVTSFILDGEMMGWHKERQCFGSKGLSYDIKKITENSKYRPCYCVFDVLYYNGVSLVGPPEKGGKPLRERLQKLDTLFRDEPGVIQRSKSQIVKNSSDILVALNKAIENQDEGIVVKDVDSYYIVNRRNAGWYKIKPEYTDGTMSDLDLVIVGADEAENKRQGRAKSFFVACADFDETGERWVCVGRVATGLSFEQRETLCAALERRWTPRQRRAPPACLLFNKEIPDFWILPEHSVSLTVRATELIRSTDFGTAYTLRFPRVVRVREDKPVKDVMTLAEFNQLVANKGAVVKLSTNQINQDPAHPEGELKVRKKRTAQTPQVAEHLRVKPSDDVEVTSRALLGRKLCILSEDEVCSRLELANMIKSLGGDIVADPAHAWCCIAGRITARVRSYIDSESQDIVTSSWLRTLPPAPAPRPLHPLDLLAIKNSTKRALAREYDAFGDGYTELTDDLMLKRCFDKMDTNEPKVFLTNLEMQALDGEVFGQNNRYSFLRSCCICVADTRSLRAIQARMYGGTVVGTPTLECTHIVLPKESDPDRVEDMRRFQSILVSEDWLETCYATKELVSETQFIL